MGLAAFGMNKGCMWLRRAALLVEGVAVDMVAGAAAGDGERKRRRERERYVERGRELREEKDRERDVETVDGTAAGKKKDR